MVIKRADKDPVKLSKSSQRNSEIRQLEISSHHFLLRNYKAKSSLEIIELGTK